MTGQRGQAPTTTPRDDAVLLDVYLADWATTDQLARWHFSTNAPKRAYNRLLDLRSKGLLTNVVLPTDGPGEPVRISFWSLTKEGRARVGASLSRRGLTLQRLFAEPPNEVGRARHTNPEFAGLDPFDQAVAYHLRSVTELYGDLKGPLLVAYGNAGEGWLWRNERRAYIPWGDTGAHHFRPDAELLLDYPSRPSDPGEPDRFHVYFEVQTARSKRSQNEVARRLNNHYLATQLAGFPDASSRLLVFVGENPSHVRAAREAADRLGMPNLCAAKDEALSVLRGAISAVASGRSPLANAVRSRAEPPTEERAPSAGQPFATRHSAPQPAAQTPGPHLRPVAR